MRVAQAEVNRNSNKGLACLRHFKFVSTCWHVQDRAAAADGTSLDNLVPLLTKVNPDNSFKRHKPWRLLTRQQPTPGACVAVQCV